MAHNRDGHENCGLLNMNCLTPLTKICLFNFELRDLGYSIIHCKILHFSAMKFSSKLSMQIYKIQYLSFLHINCSLWQKCHTSFHNDFDCIMQRS
jgi:hypothetical protein